MRGWLVIASIVLGLLLVESGARLLVSIEGGTPPHWDRARLHEWRWASNHLEAGTPVLPGTARYDPDLGWVLQEGLASDGIRTNSAGIRADREFEEQPTRERPRVLFVGDSYTFGTNVANEDTFQALLERDYFPGSDMINLGVPGYGLDQALLMYERRGRRYHADIVVLGFFDRGFFRAFESFRDYAKPYFELDEAGRLELEGVPVPAPETLYGLYASGKRRIAGASHSYLAAILLGQLDRLARDRSVARDSREWQLTAAILRRFHDGVIAQGSQPFLLIFADRPRKCGDCVFSQISALAEQEARDLGLPVLSLREPFLEHPDEQLFHPLGSGGHFNARGHELTARLLHEALRERLGTDSGM